MKSIIVTALLVGFGGFSLAQGQSEAPSAPAPPITKDIEPGRSGVFRINTTWAETGVASTGIASSDFLHNDLTKPASKPIFQDKSVTTTPAAAPAADTMASADGDASDAPQDQAPADSEAEAAPAPAPEAAPASPAPAASSASSTKPRSRTGSASASSSSGRSPSPSPSAAPRPPAPSSGGGKDVVVASGKDIMVEDLLLDPPSLFELSVDAGYQSRYYYLGINRVLNAAWQASPSDTDVWYGGVSANWNGFGGGVKYVRGTTTLETYLSTGGKPVFKVYEEVVANINYSLDVLPDGWLNVTGGYRAIFLEEETWYNANRFDDAYIIVSNSVLPFLRPSVTYHYLDQDSPPGEGANTLAPGIKRHEGQLLILQVDGQLGLPAMTGLPFDMIYYAQVGFDYQFNVQANDWDQNWTQVGITFPIVVGPATVSPNWNYNETSYDESLVKSEHFWGVNLRFDF